MSRQITLDFVNSTSQTKEDRFKERVKAASQAKRIYDLLQDGRKRTSVMVADELDINLNSTRRALTQLERYHGVIKRTNEVQKERYGAFNYFYTK